MQVLNLNLTLEQHSHFKSAVWIMSKSCGNGKSYVLACALAYNCVINMGERFSAIDHIPVLSHRRRTAQKACEILRKNNYDFEYHHSNASIKVNHKINPS